MLKSPSALLFSAAVFSTASHAVILDQQWGSWFGTISAMEFEINTDNASNERLTLTCTGGHLALAYSVPAEDYRLSSENSLAEPGLNIESKTYSLGEAAFMALKNSGDRGQVTVTSMGQNLSKSFKTAGLREVLQDVTWQDCVSR
ncbi:hypothetical protein ACMWRF_004659 [Enterobacter hormaechei]|uniref:hypothetical protein n=1 Tax=Enterobacter hormaechei TaxID=158836 RepID=UPI000CF9E807|nr:hypothetical protein [Enterobacter hormaechei]AVJ82859.1 hypothetical protein CSC02_4493 [Enterobacter hormaechei subsp. hoffmannii]EKU3266151.1 hypothetical protein [Enterobacter hormaechei]EKU3268045.1 hypothetical protein [Enterobacter hormaechei]EKU3270841.1 hypothetical protein [Enterobacter hormaechei]EKW3906869.1 hypothetical protein [Enterobacter hormaechei]